ncbi:hypothetical protein [Rhodobacter calidifons]|uniref:Acyltransferase-like protein n=1 Tax=Rhodobacter calidifons TaxID=2715277 RepID=A0ABX0G9B7_9RHOB|nr:hypothetical protein [Rhodobacter calidifons]NHB77900.1 hypothetical protein [Rhodobacter calidifons]
MIGGLPMLRGVAATLVVLFHLQAAALIYGLAAGGWRMPGWALVWGEASYLPDLLHLLVFSVAGTLLRMAGVAPYGSLLSMLAPGLLATAASVAATLWVERPYLAWAKGRRPSA